VDEAGPVVTEVRAFNRFYTRVIGVLDDGLAGSPHTLTEARVLFELAQAGTVDVPDLRRDLGLDAGYLSRILARFTADGLVVRETSTVDARRQVARLTPSGERAFAELEALQVRAVDALLDPLSDGDRERLTGAMSTIRGVLTPGAGAVALRPLQPGDLGWVVSRHGALYAAEYGWDAAFETLVARILAGYDRDTGAGWIAELDGERAGCVFRMPADVAGTAQLRLLLVEPAARGHGIGRRLVERCLSSARDAGYARITLWTNDVLVAARRIYLDAGFTLDREEPHHSFGHDLVGQFWSRDL
jgi:DNA-binding MarR family transcriptional regulator/GNAT superfamily N-acetyltransferase